MDLKVYEGYKHTSTSNNSSATRPTAQTLSAFNQAFNKNTEIQSENVQPVNANPIEINKPVNAQPISKNSNAKPRIALFIDVDNVGISRENLLEIIFYANGKYQIDQCSLYGFSDETLPGIREIAAEYNVTTIGKMKFKQSGVNCLDSRLLIDAYECALNNHQRIDMVFVWCYPCDLSELFEKMQNLGVNTATIENNAFDCKNRFVSQTFKLYSPYNFTVEQSSYGKIRNQPAQIAPSENIEKDIETNHESNIIIENQEPKVDIKPVEVIETKTEMVTETKTETNNQTVNIAPEPVVTNKAETVKEDTAAESKTETASKSSILDDDFVPPVLPRRTIVERSSSKLLRKDEENDNTETSVEPETKTESESEIKNEETNSPSSMVEEIARKLNLPILTDEEIEEEMREAENTVDESSILRDLLKQTGLGGFGDEEKSLKYEDTIGDL